jgi:hypothetical protein
MTKRDVCAYNRVSTIDYKNHEQDVRATEGRNRRAVQYRHSEQSERTEGPKEAESTISISSCRLGKGEQHAVGQQDTMTRSSSHLVRVVLWRTP